MISAIDRDAGGERNLGTIYKWEQNLQRSWEVVTEDSQGNIHVAPNKSIRSISKLRSSERDRLACIRRGLIRYLV